MDLNWVQNKAKFQPMTKKSSLKLKEEMEILSP